MSGEFRQVTVAFTTRDGDETGVYADEVSDEIARVCQAALDEWYAKRGRSLLRTEPSVT